MIEEFRKPIFWNRTWRIIGSSNRLFRYCRHKFRGLRSFRPTAASGRRPKSAGQPAGVSSKSTGQPPLASMPRFCPGPGAQNERNRHQQCQKRTPEAISSCPSMARSKEPTSTYACVPADVSCAGPGTRLAVLADSRSPPAASLL